MCPPDLVTHTIGGVSYLPAFYIFHTRGFYVRPIALKRTYMANANTLPNRQSHRYAGYDYASAGAYFITICAQDFRALFGQIDNHELIANGAGRMLQAEWANLPERFPTVRQDEFAIMPNHAHFIIWLYFNPESVAPSVPAGLVPASNAEPKIWLHPTVGDFVGVYKSLTTHAYSEGVKNQGWPRFAKRLWQRDYYDHIIRDEIELEQIRHYIRTNPARWLKDQLHPNAPPNPFNRNKLND